MSIRIEVQEKVKRERAGRNGSAPKAARPADEPDAWQEVLPLSTIPAAAPFPLDVLPAPARRFVVEVAWALNCPPDFAAVPLLAVAGGAVGNSQCLAITNSHHQSACLFAMTVGAPGSLKSPALDLVMEPVELAERRLHKEAKRLLAEWKKEDAATRAEKPPKPARILLDDATTEGVAPALEANERGCLMARDELASLVCGLDQYKNGKGNDRQFYLKLWGHSTIRVDRKGNADGMPLQVFRPFVAIVGGVQPGVIDKLRGGRHDDGFLDRFLICYPDDVLAAAETWRVVSEGASEGWRGAVDGLLKLEMVTEEDGTKRPWIKHLTASGRKAWADFTEEHAAELNREDFPSHLRGPWSKLRGYCGRLALIIHLLRLACQETRELDVDGDSMRRAAVLVAYFKAHARRVYSALAADRGTEAALRLLEWIARREVKQFKRWEAHKGLESQEWFPRIEDLDGPIDRLMTHHFLRLHPAPKKSGGGRPADPVYEVNPSWDRRVNRVNRGNPSTEGVSPVYSVYPAASEEGGTEEDAEAVGRNPFRTPPRANPNPPGGTE